MPASARPRRTLSTLTLAGVLAVSLLAPAGAQAGTAISSLPNLPSGARAGGTLTVPESGLPGQVSVTQTFNGADALAIARLRQIRLALNCGPGPSVGNPSGNGPAVNDPETPCTNPDLGVFGALSPLGIGGRDCAGISFAITPPDGQGQVDLLPSLPVYLLNWQTCEISFTFSVLRLPAKDTFPNATGMQTTSVSAVRSEVVADSGNPAAIGLQAAGLGSGDAVRVEQPPPSSPPPEPPCTPTSTDGSCGGARSNTASSPKLRVAAACVRGRVKASVTGTGIRKVTYTIDGRVARVVKGKSPYKLNISARRLRTGSHKLTATVAYRSSSNSAQVLSRRIARCRAPNFTG